LSKKKEDIMIKKVGNFVAEVRGELAKVSWSTREELMGSTAVVLTLTGLMAVFIGVIDFLLSYVLKLIFK